MTEKLSNLRKTIYLAIKEVQCPLSKINTKKILPKQVIIQTGENKN